MNALVLAAGRSTRIAGVSGGRPKPLIEIAGQPVIARTLAWLARAGVRDVTVNLHYRPDDIRNALGDGSAFGVRITYAPEPEILGTAGAFRAVAAGWQGESLVIYGDNLMAFDLAAFVDAHRRSGAQATVAVFDPDQHANSRIAGGRVLLDRDSLVTGFVEGAPDPAAASRGYVNAGAYVLDAALASEVPPGFADFARDVFPPLVAQRRLRGYLMEAGAYCIGLDTPESLRVAEDLVSTRQVVLA